MRSKGRVIKNSFGRKGWQNYAVGGHLAPQAEARQDYSHQCDEEIKAREGGTPSPVVYDTSSPSVGTPGAPVRQKKKISFAEYQSRLPREDPSQSHAEEAEW